MHFGTRGLMHHARAIPSNISSIYIMPFFFGQFMNYSLSIQSGYTAYTAAGMLWITPKKPMFRTSNCG